MHYFTFNELIRTDQKVEHNYPSLMEHIENLVCLCDFLDEIRDEFRAPIFINSAFRTPVVNSLVRGRPHSLHMQGRAADIRPDYIPAIEYQKNLQDLITVVKKHEDELSEFVIYPTFIHVAI